MAHQGRDSNTQPVDVTRRRALQTIGGSITATALFTTGAAATSEQQTHARQQSGSIEIRNVMVGHKSWLGNDFTEKTSFNDQYGSTMDVEIHVDGVSSNWNGLVLYSIACTRVTDQKVVHSVAGTGTPPTLSEPFAITQRGISTGGWKRDDNYRAFVTVADLARQRSDASASLYFSVK